MPIYYSGRNFTNKEAGIPRKSGVCPKYSVLASDSSCSFQPSVFSHFRATGPLNLGSPSVCIPSLSSQTLFSQLAWPLLYHWGPLRSVLHFTECVNPGEGPLCSATDEGQCQGRRPATIPSTQPTPALSFPLLGLSSPSWPSWPWGTVSSVKTKKRFKGNF